MNDIPTSGRFGDLINWYYDSRCKKVTLSGTGKLKGNFNEIIHPYSRDVREVEILNGITAIDDSVFRRAKIRAIIIPNSVTNIGVYAFQQCENLERIKLGNGLQRIDKGAFLLSRHSRVIYVDDLNVLFNVIYSDPLSNPFYYEGGKVYLDGDLLQGINIPGSMQTVGKYQYYGYRGLSVVRLNEGITRIDDYAFCDCEDLSSLIIPNSVKSIGVRSISWCDSLNHIIIPGSVASIDNEAFLCCQGLSDLTIMNGVERIGDRAFMGCSRLLSVAIPESVRQIGQYAIGYMPEEKDDEDVTKIQDFTIIGKKRTEAQRYANFCGIRFKDIDELARPIPPLSSQHKADAKQKSISLEQQIAAMLKVNSGITVGSVVAILSRKYDNSEVCKAMCEYLKDQYLV